MVRPWPVDFLNNAKITICNHMNSWTRLSLGTFMITLQFVLSYSQDPCSPLDFLYYRFTFIVLASVCFSPFMRVTNVISCIFIVSFSFIWGNYTV